MEVVLHRLGVLGVLCQVQTEHLVLVDKVVILVDTVVAEVVAITVAEVVVIKIEPTLAVEVAVDHLFVTQLIVLQLLTRRDTLQLLVTGP